MALILDGGSTSVLEHLSEQERDHVMSSPLWTSQALFSFPQAVTSMYKDYISAGADIVSCMTYQQSELTMKHVAGVPDAYDVGMRTALQSCRQTEAKPVLCLGTHAAMLGNGAEYNHKYDSNDFSMLKQFHSRRLHEFSAMKSWSNIEYLAFETLPDVLEAEAILEVLKDEYEKLPDLKTKRIWISFSCSGTNAEEKVITGLQQLLIHECIDILWGVGINCFKEDKAKVVKPFCDLLAGSKLHAIIYRDAGPQWDAVQRKFIGNAMPPTTWAAIAAGDAGLNEGKVVIGGCCQTTPQHIRALRAHIESTSK